MDPPADAGRFSEAQTPFSKSLVSLPCFLTRPSSRILPEKRTCREQVCWVPLGSPGAAEGGGACAFSEACEEFAGASEHGQDTSEGVIR